MIEQADLAAIIIDLDGVITRTAKVHARAWKETFDEFLGGRGGEPFDLERDYHAHVDGKPRHDGVRDFLRSRQITLPEGKGDDPPEAETVCGIGNRKNEKFHQWLEQEGVELFDDAAEQLERWRQQQRKLAVVSASKNCQHVLRAAGIEDWFDVRVDGETAAQLDLPGKPKPDMFLEAARRLQVEPSHAMVVEDAVAGVQAGRAGDFSLVVGVARHDNASQLQQAGADLIVERLTQLETNHHNQPEAAMNSRLMDLLARMEQESKEHELAFFLDYDGTLTPIVERPEDAQLSSSMRQVLQALVRQCRVVIVSGRDRQDVEQLVHLEDLIYAGSHGFDISGPGEIQLQHPEGQSFLPAIEEAEQQLQTKLSSVAGAQVERKRFAIAIHYRRVAEEDTACVEQIVDEVQRQHPQLRKRGGKKIFELQPDVDWNKGRAVSWLLKELGLDHPGVVPVYLGDDDTDEDAFAALRDSGIGILVGDTEQQTQASYHLADPGEVQTFLTQVTAITGCDSPSQERQRDIKRGDG